MLLVLGLAFLSRGDLAGLHSHYGGAGELTGTLSFSQLKSSKKKKEEMLREVMEERMEGKSER